MVRCHVCKGYGHKAVNCWHRNDDPSDEEEAAPAPAPTNTTTAAAAPAGRDAGRDMRGGRSPPRSARRRSRSPQGDRRGRTRSRSPLRRRSPSPKEKKKKEKAKAQRQCPVHLNIVKKGGSVESANSEKMGDSEDKASRLKFENESLRERCDRLERAMRNHFGEDWA